MKTQLTLRSFGKLILNNILKSELKSLVILLLSLFSFQTHAQTQWQWALSPDSANYADSYVRKILYTNSGNILALGLYGGPLAINGNTLQHTGQNFFVANVTSGGSLNWIKRGSGSSVEGSVLCTDNAGNIYVAGSFSQTLTISSAVLTHSNGNAIFMAKYDPAGNLLWAKKIAQGWIQNVSGLKWGTGGVLHLAGNFTTPNNGNSFIIGSHTLTTVPNTSDYDIFYARLDTSGSVLAAQQFGNGKMESINDLEVTSAGEVILNGSFTSSVLTVGGFSLTGPSGSLNSLFLVKFNSSGSVVWAKKIDNVGGGGNICADISGNIYLAGAFSSTQLAVNSFTLVKTSAPANGMLIKFDASGNALWLEGIGGQAIQGGDYFSDVDINAAGDIYVGATINSASLTIGGNVIINNGPVARLLILRYNSAGTNFSVNMAGENNSHIYGISIIAGTSALHVAGYYVGSQITFGNISKWGTGNPYSNFFIAEVGSLPTGLAEQHSGLKLNMFPNPVINDLTIESDQVITNIRVFDAGLREVWILECSSNTVVLPLTKLEAGFYFVEATSADKRKSVAKVVKVE